MSARRTMARLIGSPLLIALILSVGLLAVVFLVAPNAKAVSGAGVPNFGNGLPIGANNVNTETKVVAIADLNNDGAPEIVTGDDGGQNYVYLFVNGTYADPVAFGTGLDTTRALTVTDVNDDGTPDIIVGNYGQQSVVYLNILDHNKIPHFSSGVLDCTKTNLVRCFGPENDLTTSVAVNKIDDDDFPDIVAGNDGKGDPEVYDKVYINEDNENHHGFFDYSNLTSCDNNSNVRCFGQQGSKTTSVVVADVNNDSANDIIVGDNGSQSAIYLNDLDRKGTFFAGTNMECGNTSVSCFGNNSDPTYSLEVKDIDSDGNLDVIVGNFSNQSAVYFNNPVSNKPTFVQPDPKKLCSAKLVSCFGPSQRGSTQSVAVDDINGDGKLDIVVGRAGQLSQIYLNKGSGSFDTTSPWVLSFGFGDNTSIDSVAVDDLNGDRSPDIVAVGKGVKNIFFTQAPQFTVKPFGESTDTILSITATNLDEDKFVDLAATNGTNSALVFQNKGDGSFDALSPIAPGDGAKSVAVGKLDSNSANPYGLFVASNLADTVTVLSGNATTGFIQLDKKDVHGNPQMVLAAPLQDDHTLDFIVATNAVTSNIEVWKGNGAGVFSRSLQITNTGTFQTMAVQKLNTTSFDLVIANNDSTTIRVWSGAFDGAGNLTLTPKGPDIDLQHRPHALAITDLNKDKKNDIVVVNSDGTISLLYGNSNGTFNTPVLKVASNPATELDVEDMNGDHFNDLVVSVLMSDGRGAIRIYFNDGKGNFAIGSDECNQFGKVICYIPTEVGTISNIRVADMNGDTIPDLVIGRVAGQSAVYLNNLGWGTIESHPLPGFLGSIFSTAVGDLNNDGAIDLIMGRIGGQSEIYMNDGDGGFQTAQHFGAQGAGVASLAVGDMNNDGTLDIIVGDFFGQSVIYLNDRAQPGNFSTTTPDCTANIPNPDKRTWCFARPSDMVRSIAVADLNNDKYLDIVVGSLHAGTTIYFNHGNDTLQSYTQPLPGGNDSATSLAIGDLDGVNGPDIVIGSSIGQDKVYFNDGSGSFSRTQNLGALDTSTQSVALGDMDGQNGLDITVGNIGKQDVVYLNDGNGVFSSTVNLVKTFGADDGRTYSIAPADVDGDGSLDLVVGNYGSPSQVYLNPGIESTNPWAGFNENDTILVGIGITSTMDIAASDLNGDGALDLVAINSDNSRIYLSDGAGKYPPRLSAQNLPGPGSPRRMAIADMEGHGALDLVAISESGQGAIYLNDQNSTATFATTPDRMHTFTTSPGVSSIAVADITDTVGSNGQHGLDIVVGNNGQQSAVYLNQGNGNFAGPDIPFGGPSDPTTSVAVADVNGDNRLDLIVGKSGQQSAVYLQNANGSYFSGSDLTCDQSDRDKVRCFGGASNHVTSIAAGDVNHDGMIDLLVGYNNNPSILYFNNGLGDFDTSINCGNPTTYRCIGSSLGSTFVAMSDINGDGFLDIVQAVHNGSFDYIDIYLNDAHDNFLFSGSFSGISPYLRSLAVVDANADGASDLVLGSNSSQSAVYINNGYGNFSAQRARLFGGSHDIAASVAGGDLDHDGAIDLVTSDNTGQISIFLHGQAKAKQLANNPPYIVIKKPGSTPDANFISSPTPIAQTVIPIIYTLYDSESDPVRAITAEFSLDGGANWQIAEIARDPLTKVPRSQTEDLVTSPNGIQYTYYWDTFASEFFGQSDNVVFRIKAYPAAHPYTGTVALYTGMVSGPYQRPYVATQTFPFRVRGTQVQVECQDQSAAPRGRHVVYLPLIAQNAVPGISLPADPITDCGAQVYRLRGDPPRGGPLSNDGQPSRINPAGFLLDRPDLRRGDRLVALQPIAKTNKYDIYLTSARPISDGLDAYVINKPGVQLLTVTDTNPLILFNLSIALEWDALPGDDYIKQLTTDLTRTSELLYDWTNGQAALGTITISDNKGDAWKTADIRIYASNNIRPNADIGGIADQVLQQANASNAKRQIRIGAVWNRNGDPSGKIGEDWPRALAHELGHYLFFLDDNYLGLDPQGRLSPVESCPGVMNDPYIPEESEYRTPADWLPDCANTLSNAHHQTADWAIMGSTFSWLRSPAQAFHENTGNSGPSNLPLLVTHVRFDDNNSITPIKSPIFNVQYQRERYTSVTTRAFLFHGDRLIDLGVAVSGSVTARGAQVGDRLCAFDTNEQVLGCTSIKDGSAQLILGKQPTWPPEVLVKPERAQANGTQIVHVTVRGTNLPVNIGLSARLYPLDGSTTETQTLDLYTSEFTFTLQQPAEAGYVHVWVNENDPRPGTTSLPRREVITEYGLGGSPTRRAISADAPASSPDGQVLLYGPDLKFEAGQFYTLQVATNLPVRPPPWGTAVGKAYRLTASARAPDLHGTSLNFSYLGRDVTPGENKPAGLRIYYLPEQGTQWQMLETKVASKLNVAIAATAGPGIYLLMSSIPKELFPAWDSFVYSGDELPVEAALKSIDNYWLAVGTLGEEGVWLVYDRKPGGIKTLTTLKPGRGYQIKVTQHVTLLLRGGRTSTTVANANGARTPDVASPMPWAFYYGVIQPSASFIPSGDMPVRAWVDDILCGQGQTTETNGQILYNIAVNADRPGAAGCGAPGRLVTFQIGDQWMTTVIAWSNDHAYALTLRR